MRALVLILVLLQAGLAAQQRPGTSTVAKGKKQAQAKRPPVSRDSVAAEPSDPSDTLDPRDLDYRAWREFAVYNKRGRVKDRRLKLCYQLLSD
jgi:hypothetical protein